MVGFQQLFVNARSVPLRSACIPCLRMGEFLARDSSACAPGSICDPESAVSTFTDDTSTGDQGRLGCGGWAWGELGEGGSSPRSPDPPSSPPASLETLSTATSPRHLAERTRGRRCPGNAGMPSNKSTARVTCPGQTNPSARPEAGQSGPKSASLPPPSFPRRQQLGANYRNCCRRAPGCEGAGTGGWAGPEGLSREGTEAGPSYSSSLAFASITAIKALIKRLLCTPTVGEESRRACGRVGDTRAWVFLGLGGRIRSMGLIPKIRGLRGTVQSLLALLNHTHTPPPNQPSQSAESRFPPVRKIRKIRS